MGRNALTITRNGCGLQTISQGQSASTGKISQTLSKNQKDSSSLAKTLSQKDIQIHKSYVPNLKLTMNTLSNIITKSLLPLKMTLFVQTPC